MIFKNICILVVWTKVVSALEGLRVGCLPCNQIHLECTPSQIMLIQLIMLTLPMLRLNLSSKAQESKDF